MKKIKHNYVHPQQFLGSMRPPVLASENSGATSKKSECKLSCQLPIFRPLFSNNAENALLKHSPVRSRLCGGPDSGREKAAYDKKPQEFGIENSTYDEASEYGVQNATYDGRLDTKVGVGIGSTNYDRRSIVGQTVSAYDVSSEFNCENLPCYKKPQFSLENSIFESGQQSRTVLPKNPLDRFFRPLSRHKSFSSSAIPMITVSDTSNDTRFSEDSSSDVFYSDDPDCIEMSSQIPLDTNNPSQCPSRTGTESTVFITTPGTCATATSHFLSPSSCVRRSSPSTRLRSPRRLCASTGCTPRGPRNAANKKPERARHAQKPSSSRAAFRTSTQLSRSYPNLSSSAVLGMDDSDLSLGDFSPPTGLKFLPHPGHPYLMHKKRNSFLSLLSGPR